MNQDAVLGIALPVTLFLIMFGMGANLRPHDFRQLIARPASVLSGLASQMLLLPLLAYLLLSALALPAEITIGFMILAAPPPTYSPTSPGATSPCPSRSRPWSASSRP